MTDHTGSTPVDLPCHVCGYDLRAQPGDGKCPECGASVAESRRWAAIPRRPAWRDSDPRWRRRVLAGAWVLVLLPLMDVLLLFEWASGVPVPGLFKPVGTIRTLDDTLLSFRGVYHPLVFCIGVTLLFAKERGRRPGPLDWTRRWGVVCTYVVLLLSAAQVLFVGALVLAGIAAVFQSMPLENQPRVTPWLAGVSTGYLRYGAQASDASAVVLVAFSSAAVGLACIPLFDALRSSGPKRLAAVVLAPLALFALVHVAQAGRYCAGRSYVRSTDVSYYAVYFWPELLVRGVGGFSAGPGGSGSVPGAAFVEAAKWCSILAAAVWLSVARLTARRRGRHATPA